MLPVTEIYEARVKQSSWSYLYLSKSLFKIKRLIQSRQRLVNVMLACIVKSMSQPVIHNILLLGHPSVYHGLCTDRHLRHLRSPLPFVLTSGGLLQVICSISPFTRIRYLHMFQQFVEFRYKNDEWPSPCSTLGHFTEWGSQVLLRIW